MKREIKFRAWDKKKKEMWYVPDIYSVGHLKFKKSTDDLIWLQFTGLKDKNGKGRWSKEIYEGDIIEDEKGERFEIMYQKEWGAFIADQGELGELFFLAKDKTWANNDKLLIKNIKVIGNIWENPELFI